MHHSGGHFEIAQYDRYRKKIASLSADSEIARSCQLVTKISEFCNEVTDYLVKPPYLFELHCSCEVRLINLKK